MKLSGSGAANRRPALFLYFFLYFTAVNYDNEKTLRGQPKGLGRKAWRGVR